MVIRQLTSGASGVGPLRASVYQHKETPNSSVPDRMVGMVCPDPSQQVAPCVNTGDWYETTIAARSRHPGGVNVVFADGHVGFYVDEVDLDVWQFIGHDRRRRSDFGAVEHRK